MSYAALMVLSGVDGPDSEIDYYRELQGEINAGTAWKSDPRVGRLAMKAIRGGYCLLGRESARDYYGNYIPSRTEVLDEAEGSPSFVTKARGYHWASTMEDVE